MNSSQNLPFLKNICANRGDLTSSNAIVQRSCVVAAVPSTAVVGMRRWPSAGVVSAVVFNQVAIRQLLQFVAAILLFNGSEYALAVAFHGKSTVTSSSFLFSKQYSIAIVSAVIEYMVELFIFPEIKEHRTASNIGLAMVLVGEIIRKCGILTARQAFTHDIKIHHEEHHHLVTHGIYRFVRHPGYCGFFIWAVGTQMMLCNPICIVAFAVVTWLFFHDRIPYEEFFLRQFFGSQYEEYANQAPSGLPFI